MRKLLKDIPEDCYYHIIKYLRYYESRGFMNTRYGIDRKLCLMGIRDSKDKIEDWLKYNINGSFITRYIKPIILNIINKTCILDEYEINKIFIKKHRKRILSLSDIFGKSIRNMFMNNYKSFYNDFKLTELKALYKKVKYIRNNYSIKDRLYYINNNIKKGRWSYILMIVLSDDNLNIYVLYHLIHHYPQNWFDINDKIIGKYRNTANLLSKIFLKIFLLNLKKIIQRKIDNKVFYNTEKIYYRNYRISDFPDDDCIDITHKQNRVELFNMFVNNVKINKLDKKLILAYKKYNTENDRKQFLSVEVRNQLYKIKNNF